jgi:VIT1/CCC1 family predicted Fe2+/Mn2+ transporter
MVECEIAEKALKEHFGAKTGLGSDLTNALEKGRDRIQVAARDRLTHDATSRCAIGSADVR